MPDANQNTQRTVQQFPADSTTPAAKPLAILLTPVLPEPGKSGLALRAWSWLHELRQEYRVLVLLALTPEQCPPIPSGYPAEAILPIGDVIRTKKRWMCQLGLLLPWLALFAPACIADWPLPVSGTAWPGLDDWRQKPVRRVVVFRLYLHRLGLALSRFFPQAVLDLDMDDRESATRLSVATALMRMGAYKRALHVLLGAVQYALVERFATGPYQTVWLAAAQDCQRLKTRMAPSVAVHPNRIPLPDFALPAARTDGIHLLFVGTLDWPPNEEAVYYLLDKVVPLLQRSGRSWQLCVAGRNCPPALRQRLQGMAQIELQPDVPDLSECYGRANIVLVPLQSGGGTKLKTLEAFARKRPVVSTPEGVRGLGAEAGIHYVSAQSPSEFVAAIMKLADNQALVACMVQQAYVFCRDNFAVVAKADSNTKCNAV